MVHNATYNGSGNQRGATNDNRGKGVNGGTE